MSSPIKPLSHSTTKLVFFGTHDFAAQILQGLLDNPRFSVELVITQPDKPVGRKQELQPPAVKILAEKYSLKIDQPVSLKTYKLIQPQRDPARCGTNLQTYTLGVCAQYGLIIPQTILDAPKHGIINVHASLLPKYRGASPIQTALMNGETETGITIIKMDAKMDTGPILLQKSVKIDPDDTYPILEQKLAKTANFALTDAILGYISGKIVPQPQDDTKATYTKILTRENGKIDWSKSAQEIYNQYRGLTPWPGVWTTLNGKRLKLLKIKPADIKLEIGNCPAAKTEPRCGVGKLEIDKIYFGCGKDSVEVLELQTEGNKTMSVKEFINGYGNKIKWQSAA